MDYDEACRRAAENQGLVPVIDTLTEAGVECQLYQSGGFCMIVTVPVRDEIELWITEDDVDYTYLVTRRDLNDEEADEWPPDPDEEWTGPLDQLVSTVNRFKEVT